MYNTPRRFLLAASLSFEIEMVSFPLIGKRIGHDNFLDLFVH
jgi:hypothetical protein